MAKTCSVGHPCAYRYTDSGSLGYGCSYTGYCDYQLPRDSRGYQPSADPERIAQLLAHRACCGSEHDPASGKFHGYCVVCAVPWPCAYAGKAPEETCTCAMPTWTIEDKWHCSQCGRLLPNVQKEAGKCSG